MLRADIVKKYGCEVTADELIHSKESDPALRRTQVRDHPELPGRADLRLYLCWDSSFETDTEDVLISEMLEVAQKDSHGRGRSKDRKKKKDKRRDRGGPPRPARALPAVPAANRARAAGILTVRRQNPERQPPRSPRTKKSKKGKKEGKSKPGSSPARSVATRLSKQAIQKAEKERQKAEEQAEKKRQKEEETAAKKRQKDEENEKKKAEKEQKQQVEKEKQKIRASGKKVLNQLQQAIQDLAKKEAKAQNMSAGFRDAALLVVSEQKTPLINARTNLQGAVDKDSVSEIPALVTDAESAICQFKACKNAGQLG